MNGLSFLFFPCEWPARHWVVGRCCPALCLTKATSASQTPPLERPASSPQCRWSCRSVHWGCCIHNLLPQDGKVQRTATTDRKSWALSDRRQKTSAMWCPHMGTPPKELTEFKSSTDLLWLLFKFVHFMLLLYRVKDFWNYNKLATKWPTT